MTSPLAARMAAFADTPDCNPSVAVKLRSLAAALDTALVSAPLDARRVLGCWARARAYYSEVTGQPLP